MMTETTWPPITPLDTLYGPRFPVEALPTPFRVYAKSLAEAYQVPVDLPALLMLTAASVPLAKRVEIKAANDWFEPANLYTAVVLPPASRKSAIFKAVTEPLDYYEQRQVKKYAEIIADAKQERGIHEKALKNAEKRVVDAPPGEKDAALAEAQELRKKLPDIPSVPCILVDDVSPEKLASVLAEQEGRLALMSAEGGVFDMIAGRYSNGTPNLDVYLKAHAGDNIRVDRLGRPPEHVISPALTIGLTIQPDVLRGLAGKPGFRGRGLLARFLFCLPPSGIGHRKIITEPVHPGELATYQRIILDLFRHFDRRSRNMGSVPMTGNYRESPAPVILTLTADAAGLFRVFRTKTEHELAAGGRFAFLGDWAGKLCGTVARIAGILHMVKQAHEQSQGQSWNTEVSADTMRAALTIGEYLANHALVAFEFMGGDPTHEAATHALAWIDRNGKTQFSLRDAHQALKGRYRNVAEIENALSVLEEHGYVRKITGQPAYKQGRRPSPQFAVNPEVDAQNSQNGLKMSG